MPKYRLNIDRSNYWSWEISAEKGEHFESWGWFSPNKLPLFVVEEWMVDEMSPKQRKNLFLLHKKYAEQIIEDLNGKKNVRTPS